MWIAFPRPRREIRNFDGVGTIQCRPLAKRDHRTPTSCAANVLVERSAMAQAVYQMPVHEHIRSLVITAMRHFTSPTVYLGRIYFLKFRKWFGLYPSVYDTGKWSGCYRCFRAASTFCGFLSHELFISAPSICTRFLNGPGPDCSVR